ncbi:2-polyprenylphenol 6-hydroxylase [Dongia sp.]|uniref:2-polyprenylphenol 6-hydroxylase n=1 Tax=Dongia sp. TaxID=1977262 RepID=UPI0035B2E20C
MIRSIRSLYRLFAIAICFARHGALAPFEAALSNAGLAPILLFFARVLFGRPIEGSRPGERLAAALSELGPAFIKLGQVLSTRSDLLGEQVAADLAKLQDQLPAFSAFAAKSRIESELGAPLADLFASFDDEPVSAASISQVHFAVTSPELDHPDGRPVAVKVLRPGIEDAFQADIDLLLWIAEIIERTQPKLRRLKPVEVVRTFAATVRIEMDLRLEAASASELRDNFEGDPTYRVPAIDWSRTAQRVMTQERMIGIPMDDGEAMRQAGLDVDEVLTKAAGIFFNQAFRDGYFHGDQHPGNMTVGYDGAIQVVDFGIMGRLDRKTRFYLADMLLGFLERDYMRVAKMHIEAGYLPQTQSIDEFALALRSIGEPIQGRPLHEISFATMLGQLFSIAETFDMEVQPQLLLLQKNMLMAEGVSRQLNPTLNIWTLARPLIEQWMIENRGPKARIEQGIVDFLDVIERGPGVLKNVDRLVSHLAEGGLKLDPEALRVINRTGSNWWLWIIIAVLTAALLFR